MQEPYAFDVFPSPGLSLLLHKDQQVILAFLSGSGPSSPASPTQASLSGPGNLQMPPGDPNHNATLWRNTLEGLECSRKNIRA